MVFGTVWSSRLMLASSSAVLICSRLVVTGVLLGGTFLMHDDERWLMSDVRCPMSEKNDTKLHQTSDIPHPGHRTSKVPHHAGILFCTKAPAQRDTHIAQVATEIFPVEKIHIRLIIYRDGERGLRDVVGHASTASLCLPKDVFCEKGHHFHQR